MRGAGPGGLRFRRQHPVGPYVLDFYAPRAKLAIEVDGTAHDLPSQATRDASRDAGLAARGIRVLRFNATDVLDANRREDVLMTIAAAATPFSD